MKKRPHPKSHTHRPSPAAPPAGPKTDWGNVAAWYDALVGESGSEYHQHVVLPGVLRLLNPQPQQRVLDLACGQGVLCRLLATRGAIATGVDAAKDLITAARDRNATLATSNQQLATPPTYHTADARDLSFLPPDHFDSAACVLAIQNIHPLQPVFASVARVLKPYARFVLVMMHPAFRGPKETSWGWDDKEKIQYRRVDRYLVPRKTPITTHPGAAPDVYTWTFHKPLEGYVKPLRQSGLLIDALEEWPSHKTSTSGPRAPAENTARKEIPLFLALRAIKIPTALSADSQQ